MRPWHVLSLLVVFPMIAASRAEATSRDRLLVICVDGIAWGDFEALKKDGRFAYLQHSARLISSFPSLTNVAMVEILRPAGVPAASGFEDRYYSWEKNRMCGGVLKRLGPGFVKESFRSAFEFHPPGFLSGFEYAVPPFSCSGVALLDISAGLRKFRNSTTPVFSLYLGPTDCAAHSGGQGMVKGLLRRLDRELSKLLTRFPGTRLALYSDHGNDYTTYRPVNLGEWIERNGYRLSSRIVNEKSVVFPRFGLIGGVVLHARAESAWALAETVSMARGVRFASVKLDDRVILFRNGKFANITMRRGDLAYSPGEEDPLELGSGAVLSPDRWFELTGDHVLPDAVNRVWLHSAETVVNQATVLVDLERGYYAGSPVLDLFVALRATHGSLSAEQSLGFLATSDRELPDVISARNAWPYLQ